MDYTNLGSLLIYKKVIEISNKARVIYETLDWQMKKVIGDQFIRSIDFIGANIAEGYGRYHFLDRIKFYYNSRGSLLESKHWIYLLGLRKVAEENITNDLLQLLNELHKMLNGYISACYKNKNNS